MPTLPTHSKPTGQIHVPRVWEITGKAPTDRTRKVRAWKKAYQQRYEAMRA